MMKKLLLVVPAALLAASTATAAEGETHSVEQASRKYTLISSLRFSEADLASIETVTMTGPTRLRDSWFTQAATAKQDAADSQTRIDWVGGDGRRWSLSIGQLVQAGSSAVAKPAIDLGEAADGSSVLTDQEMVSLPMSGGRNGW
jgi:hypothetical protein